MSYSNYLKHKRSIKAKMQYTLELHKDSITKIKEHSGTKRVLVEDFQDAFDYVHKRFPKSQVKEAEVYVAKRSFLDKIGYKGIGGFYSKVEKIIIIPDVMPIPKISQKTNRWKSIQANLTPSEILVHELCHYVSGQTCLSERTMQLEEEFAYGNMVDFCRNRGRSDEDIIHNIFMPYLVSVILLKRNAFKPINDDADRDFFNRIIKEATKLGKDIIDIWDRKKDECDSFEFEDTKRRINMDLED